VPSESRRNAPGYQPARGIFRGFFLFGPHSRESSGPALGRSEQNNRHAHSFRERHTRRGELHTTRPRCYTRMAGESRVQRVIPGSTKANTPLLREGVGVTVHQFLRGASMNQDPFRVRPTSTTPCPACITRLKEIKTVPPCTSSTARSPCHHGPPDPRTGLLDCAVLEAGALRGASSPMGIGRHG